MKDTLNRRVKFREPWRPFAPSVLAEHAADWFEIGQPSPFMLLVAPVRAEKRALAPAICHVDGSARLQTVDARHEPFYHHLIAAFYRLTGLPMVFNIVLRPDGSRPSWANPILWRMFDRVETLNQRLSLEELATRKDVFTLPKQIYEERMTRFTNQSYENFGLMTSYQVLWQR